jgi:hypothetical protein
MAHDTYAGGRVYVSSTTQGADLLQAGFEALTWIEIKPVVTQPGLGIDYNPVDQTYLTGLTQTKPGSGKVKGGDLVCGNIPDDAGQVILKGMAGTAVERAYKATRATTNTAGAFLTETVYSRCVVVSLGDEGGGVDDINAPKYTIAFNQKPIYVVA